MKPSGNFNVNELNTFDIKEYFFKIIDHWKLFVVTILLGLIIANIVNRRSQKIYKLASVITVKDEQNPLFTSSTNIAFNWGGPSDKVETIITILQSRTHNEKVVEKLNYNIEYLKQGDYRKEDVYGSIPFHIELDTMFYQLQGALIQLDFLEKEQVRVFVDFEEDEYNLMNYARDKTKPFLPDSKNFDQTFQLGSLVESPIFKFQILKNDDYTDLTGKTYFLRLNNVNGVVNNYSKIDVSSLKKGTSLIQLQLAGPNKKKLEDYINTTVDVLNRDQQMQKIQYAIKTKKYIDTLFGVESSNLSDIESELGSFKQSNNIYDLSAEGTSLLTEATSLDSEVNFVKNRLDYFNSLESYMRNRSQIDENIPAPALVNIEDPTLVNSVNSLITLSKAKENLELTVTPSYPPLKKINEEIETERKILLEHISSLKSNTQTNLSNLNRQLAANNSKLKTLSPKEQKLLNFQRKYNLSEANYNYLKQKSYEAGTAIAANVSDIKVLDRAKDTGQGPIEPKSSFNYLIGLMLGTVLPLLFIVSKEVLDNKITTVEEIERMYKIPVLGVLGKNNYENRLVVFNKPNSTIAESFRGLRSNIQFLLKRESKNKTILITSSVSKEGKTMCALNMASVFALSGKKTLIIGFDLRKPQMHVEFDCKNDKGIVNYLIGDSNLEEVIQHSKIENLDFISSGPVPPNPSELILSESTRYHVFGIKIKI
ncbi:MAG: polysaccharide biosynthesis tyrosine autokinase [Flavobacteriaceae bacterium]|nr:polysaccharide biosynthesis tyrosine autokinase [Flavobacteriaceae bacterium]